MTSKTTAETIRELAAPFADALHTSFTGEEVARVLRAAATEVEEEQPAEPLATVGEVGPVAVVPPTDVQADDEDEEGEQ